MDWRLHTCVKKSSSFPLMTLSAELKEPPPDDGPGLGVLAGGVDDGHQGHPADVADVIVDEELKVCDVDQGQIAAVQSLVHTGRSVSEKWQIINWTKKEELL